MSFIIYAFHPFLLSVHNVSRFFFREKSLTGGLKCVKIGIRIGRIAYIGVGYFFMNINKYIVDNYERIVKKEITWRELAEEVNKKFGTNLNNESCRKRYHSNRDRNFDETCAGSRRGVDEEFEEHYSNGGMLVQKKIWFDSGEEKTPEIILGKFGYSPDEWELIKWRIGYHEVAIKDEEENRVCYNVRCEMRPKIKSFATPEECVEYLQELLQKKITPLNIEKRKKNKSLYKDRLFLLPPVELHLGKFSDELSTGFEYNSKIAAERYREITKRIIEQQEIMKCDTIVIGVGNDFFNTDNIHNATSKGTPQFNDVSWKKMFTLGAELMMEQILTLEKHFNNVKVILNGSNHDTMSSFHLYYSLQQAFRNDKQVEFSNDYTDMECITFGRNGIWFHHGDCNLTRLIESIPVLYPNEYAKTSNRMLLMGHLHSYQDLKEQCGVKPLRLSSPCEPDEWHVKERFVGSCPSQDTFVFDTYGLLQHNYINFIPEEMKVKRK